MAIMKLTLMATLLALRIVQPVGKEIIKLFMLSMAV